MVSLDKKNNPTKRALFSSFKDAFSGIKFTFKNERNFRIHTVVTILVVTAGFVLKISLLEWTSILLCIGLVIAMELVNTAIEQTVDLIVGESFHELARNAKDAAAGAVVISACMSVIIGLIIFFPYVWELFEKVIESII